MAILSIIRAESPRSFADGVPVYLGLGIRGPSSPAGRLRPPQLGHIVREKRAERSRKSGGTSAKIGRNVRENRAERPRRTCKRTDRPYTVSKLKPGNARGWAYRY